MDLITYIFKEPNKDFEIRKHPIDYSIRKDLNQEWMVAVGSATIGKNLYLYFDDLGIYDYSKGRIQYNFNIPSYTDAFQNQIFGNVIIEKVNYSGEPIDVTKEDLEYIKSVIFKVTNDSIYTINHPVIKKYYSEDFIASIEREYSRK